MSALETITLIIDFGMFTIALIALVVGFFQNNNKK